MYWKNTNIYRSSVNLRELSSLYTSFCNTVVKGTWTGIPPITKIYSYMGGLDSGIILWQIEIFVIFRENLVEFFTWSYGFRHIWGKL